jgi:predicted AlkP superfamily pyrophosphatase or phosphodiesterase
MNLGCRQALQLAVLGALIAPFLSSPPALAGVATLNLVVVIDGLRPDSITAEDAPNLFRMGGEGVTFTNGHCVFPTVTRANAAAIGTGAYPARNGIFGNESYVRSVDPNRTFANGDHRNLLRLDAVTGGRMLMTKSLAEILAERGKTLAVISSGSTGSALLVNPRAPRGVGVLVNGSWEPGTRVAFPDTVNAAVLRRFPAAPRKGGARVSLIPAVSWTQRVLSEYVLPEVKPDVIVDWITEPDHIQHAFGAGSPEARAVIRGVDREIGLLLGRLRQLGLADKTNIIVVSDHGFGHETFGVDLTGELIRAGLRAGPDSDDVVIASNGAAMALYVRDRDATRIASIVRFLQRQPWADVLFTAAQPGAVAPIAGREPGTFALELVHLAQAERGPDIVLTFPWQSSPNTFGLAGTNHSAAAATGPITDAGHGGLSPWIVRNTFIAWGVDFKRATVLNTPASNVDIAPTLLALMDLEREGDAASFDGRVLREAFAGGPDGEQLPLQVRTHVVEVDDGSYRAALQVTELGRQRYIDKGWRIR